MHESAIHTYIHASEGMQRERHAYIAALSSIIAALNDTQRERHAYRAGLSAKPAAFDNMQGQRHKTSWSGETKVVRHIPSLS